MSCADRLTAGIARVARRAVAACFAPLTAIAFWAAVLLPVVYLPLLIAAGVGAVELAPALSLIGVHLLALLGGYRHARPADPPRDRARSPGDSLN